MEVEIRTVPGTNNGALARLFRVIPGVSKVKAREGDDDDEDDSGLITFLCASQETVRLILDALEEDERIRGWSA